MGVHFLFIILKFLIYIIYFFLIFDKIQIINLKSYLYKLIIITQCLKHKNIFSNAFIKENEDTYDKLDDYIYGKNTLEEKLKDIHINFEKIGKLCDRKKKSSFEEYNCALNYNKNKLNEELNKYRNKLIYML